MSRVVSEPFRFASWTECSEALSHAPPVAHGPFQLEVDGQRLFAKIGHPRGYSWLRITLIAPTVRLVAGQWPATAPLRRAGMERVAHEAGRLRHLRDEGVAVPQVKLHVQQLLVTESVGVSLAELLPTLPLPHQTDMISHLGNDMAAFHDAGHWHGAAQLRNMTWHQERIHRIDFEEDLEGVLPLHMIRAMDALLVMFSIAHQRNLGSLAGRQRLGQEFLQSWRDQLADPAPAEALTGAFRWINRVDRAAWFLRRVPSRDLDAFRVVVEALRAGLR